MPQVEEIQTVRKSRRLLNKRSSEVVPACIPEGLVPLFTKKVHPTHTINVIQIADDKLAPIFRKKKKPPSKEKAVPLAPIFLKPTQRRAPRAIKPKVNDVIEISDSESSPEIIQSAGSKDPSPPVIEISSDDNVSPEILSKQPAQENSSSLPEEPSDLTYPRSKMLELTPINQTCHVLQLSTSVQPMSPPASTICLAPFIPSIIITQPLWNSYAGILENVSAEVLKTPVPCQSTQEDGMISEHSPEPKGTKRKAESQFSPKKKAKTSHPDPEKTIMYTAKYKPGSSFKGIWRKRQVAEFRSWLECWGMNRKDDFEEEEEIVRCLLLEGATGSGKTSLVYTLAAELGYKVIEVNASTSRTGAEIRYKLKEVTQSHHMEYKSSNSSSSQKSCISQAHEVKKPTNSSVESLKKNTIKEVASQKKNASSPNSILNFFSKGPSQQSARRSRPKTPKKKKPLEVDSLHPRQEVTISSRTLILFEDVDIVFDQDEGFWRAVNEFIHSSKKPVVLTSTSSLPFILSNLKENFKLISLDYPTLKSTLECLDEVVVKEEIQLDMGLPRLLLENSGGDLRRSLLQLQFWTFGKPSLPPSSAATQAASISPNFNVGRILDFNLEVKSTALDSIRHQYWFGHNILFANLASLLPTTGISSSSIKSLNSENDIKVDTSLESDFGWAIEKDEKPLTDNTSSQAPTKTPKHILPLLENLWNLADALSDSDVFLKLSTESQDGSIYKKLQHFQDSLPKEHMDSTTSLMMPVDLPCTLDYLAAKVAQGPIADVCSAHPDLQPYLFPKLDFELLPSHEGPEAFKCTDFAKQVRNSGSFKHISNLAVHLDFTPFLRKILAAENHKIATKRSKRHLHYLDSVSIDSSKFRELL